MNKIIHNTITYAKTLLLFALFACAGLAVTAFAPVPATGNAKAEVIRCYPNPATSFVNFEFPKNIDKSYVLQVYSFVGKKMTEIPVTGNKITVTLTEYNRGLYVFQLHDKSGQTIESGKFQVVK